MSKMIDPDIHFEFFFPALLIKISKFSNFWLKVNANLFIESKLDRSNYMKIMFLLFDPFYIISLAFSPFYTSRQPIIIVAFILAKPIAVSSPTPVFAPVIKIILPLRSFLILQVAP